MANRTTLLRKDTPEYAASDIGSGFLAANYSIAALWPALFLKTDMKHLQHKDEEGEYSIPYLSTTIEQARNNLTDRSGRLLPVLSPTGKEALSILTAELSGLTGYLILDFWELWMMEPAEGEAFLAESIDQIADGNLTVLLSQASIADGDEVFRYIGFDWN